MKQRAPTKGEMAQQLNKQSGELAQKVEQLETVTRISQMLIQQVGNSVTQIANDVRELANRQRDIQYRLLALQELGGHSTEKVNEISESKQVSDFNEASEKENLELGYEKVSELADDGVVVLTTECEKPERSILRSKLVLSELSLPDLREQLLGKKVGDTFETELQGNKHKVTVLETFKAPAKPEPEETLKSVEDGEQQ